jgi:hypothetical protein
LKPLHLDPHRLALDQCGPRVGLHLALAVGGVYRAEVVRLMADGRARMRVGEREVQAQARTALVEGETVWVEVERLQPDVILRIRARQ